jgi:hypothetical protein
MATKQTSISYGKECQLRCCLVSNISVLVDLLRALSPFCLKNLRYFCAIKLDVGQKRVFLCRLLTRIQECLVTSLNVGWLVWNVQYVRDR